MNAKEIIRNEIELCINYLKISKVTSNTLEGFQSLLMLNFNSNSTVILEKDCFLSLKNLKSLEFCDNKLEKLETNQFKGLAQLETLVF